MITLHVDTSEVESSLGVLGAEAPKAVARAINRTTANVIVTMSRAIRTTLPLKASVIKARLKATQATPSRLTARVWADNKPIPLIEFQARGPEPSRGKGRGVTARTRTRHYPRAFIARMPNNHRGVFERVGKARLKIRERREASVAAVFIHHEKAGQARADEQMQKNLVHEVEYLLASKVQRAVRRTAGI